MTIERDIMQKGQKTKFVDLGIGSSFTAACSIAGPLTVDVSCFGVNDDNRLVDENYMVFYNQTSSPKGEVKFSQQGSTTSFAVEHGKLPTNAGKLVFTAAIDGAGSMSELQSLSFTMGGARFELTGQDFGQEKAIIVAEAYQKEGVWRLNAVGQGFSGGLDKLLEFYGGEVAPASSAPAAPAASPEEQKKKVFLEKRISLEKNLAQSAPQILSLAKKAAVSLEKRGLGEHKAKVALCLDISGSMSPMYVSGLVQKFVERVLALGCRLDDDGSIDVFLFGKSGYQPAPITYQDFNGYVSRIIRQHPLEGGTRYSEAMEMVRKFYTPYQYERSEPCAMDTPVYVMFVTDGAPEDKPQATRALKNAAMEPIFWQFMGVGQANFEYLEKLDDLKGRYVDNADFFAARSLDSLGDDQIFDKLMNEYPKWLVEARQKGLIVSTGATPAPTRNPRV